MLRSYNSILVGLNWLNLFMVCGKLVAMTIYVLNRLVGKGQDIMLCVFRKVPDLVVPQPLLHLADITLLLRGEVSFKLAASV